MYNFSNIFSKISYPPKNIKTVAISVIILVVVILVIYFCYIKFIAPKLKESYKLNKEQVPSFAATTGDNDAEILLFSADWCPHCKAARPEWDAVKTKYNNETINGYKVSFVDVNCTTNTSETEKLMDTYSVDGFPTVKLLKNGQIINYDAKITSANLTQFLNTAI